MSKIFTYIPQQAFELVRLRVFGILGEELANQLNALGNYLADADVYLERFIPFALTDLPAVNVTLATGEYQGQTAITSPGTYRYFIDFYHSAVTTGLEQEQSYDRLAMLNVTRLLGIGRAIIEDARYNTLGFAPPFISRRWIEKIGIAEPNDRDAAGMVKGRIILAVTVNESVPLASAIAWAENFTQLNLADTDAGYMYIQTQP